MNIYRKLLEKEHRKNNSFAKYCNKLFLIKQEMNIYRKLLEKERRKHNYFAKYCNKLFLIKQEMNIYQKLLEKEQRKHNSSIADATLSVTRKLLGEE